MSLTDREIAETRRIVQAAIKNGTADEITKKILVNALSKRLDLKEGHFDKQQKNALAEVAKEVLDEAEPGVPQSSSPVRTATAHPTKKAKTVISDDEQEEETSKQAPLKAKAKAKTAVTATKQKSAKAPSPTSDESDFSEEEPKRKKTAKPAASKKRKSESAGNNSKYRTAEFIDSEGDPITASQAGVAVSDESSNEDAPPKKKSKTTSKAAASKSKTDTKKPKAKASKKAGEALDPDEEEIKRLKSFVVACGVRKQWQKEFDKNDLHTTSSQIRWLKQLLRDLGMPSRMSLSAAKEIGERRALEKEAAELGIGIGGQPVEIEITEGRRAKRAAAARKPPTPQKISIGSSDEEEDDQSGQAESDGDDERDEETSASEDQADQGRAAKNGRKKAKEYQPEGSDEEEEEEDDDDDEAASSSSESEFSGDDDDSDA